jgi:hypothetical protein
MTEPVEGEVASAAFWTLLECNGYAVAIYSLQLTLFVSARKTLEKALDSIDSDELRFFRENLLTAFTLMIDEM